MARLMRGAAARAVSGEPARAGQTVHGPPLRVSTLSFRGTTCRKRLLSVGWPLRSFADGHRGRSTQTASPGGPAARIRLFLCLACSRRRSAGDRWVQTLVSIIFIAPGSCSRPSKARASGALKDPAPPVRRNSRPPLHNPATSSRDLSDLRESPPLELCLCPLSAVGPKGTLPRNA